MAEGWRDQAACVGVDYKVMFPSQPRGGRGRSTEEIAREAKAVCAFCPVREECLRYALDNNISHGVWGGMTPNQRTRVRRKMKVS